ncbi:Uncharacterised protein [uncultured archaeon]|nr:Uncharacterised protein [uncultured archaeon]
MSELTTEQLIKIILGILVVVAVVAGLYFFFKTQIIEFFNGLSPANPNKIFMALGK